MIKLTGPNGEAIYVRPEAIEVIRVALSHEGAPTCKSRLILVGSGYSVLETPEQVMSLLRMADESAVIHQA